MVRKERCLVIGGAARQRTIAAAKQPKPSLLSQTAYSTKLLPRKQAFR
jgi:hypothetical protein